MHATVSHSLFSNLQGSHWRP